MNIIFYIKSGAVSGGRKHTDYQGDRFFSGASKPIYEAGTLALLESFIGACDPPNAPRPGEERVSATKRGRWSSELAHERIGEQGRLVQSDKAVDTTTGCRIRVPTTGCS